MDENVEQLNGHLNCLTLIEEQRGRVAEEMTVTPGKARRVFLGHALNEGECLICLSGCPDMVQVCCGGAMHCSCYFSWLMTDASCPMCRATINFKAQMVVEFSNEENQEDQAAPSEFETARQLMRRRREVND